MERERQEIYTEKILKEFVRRLNIPDDLIEVVEFYINLSYAIGFDEGRLYINPSQLKRVGMFNKIGILINEFPNLRSAGNYVGVTKQAIYSACKNKRKVKGKYYFLYLDE